MCMGLGLICREETYHKATIKIPYSGNFSRENILVNFAEDYDSRKYSPRTFCINPMLSMFDGTLRHDDGLLPHLCGWQL